MLCVCYEVFDLGRRFRTGTLLPCARQCTGTYFDVIFTLYIRYILTLLPLLACMASPNGSRVNVTYDKSRLVKPSKLD